MPFFRASSGHQVFKVVQIVQIVKVTIFVRVTNVVEIFKVVEIIDIGSKIFEGHEIIFEIWNKHKIVKKCSDWNELF